MDPLSKPDPQNLIAGKVRLVGTRLVSTWDVLVGELDVDDVVSRLRGAVGHLAGAVLHVVTVDVHLTGALDGQAQAPVTLATGDGTRLKRSWYEVYCNNNDTDGIIIVDVQL